MQRLGRSWGWRQAASSLLIAVGVIATAYQASPRLHDRIGLLGSEYQAWQPNHGKETSTGQRLDFYYNSLKIIQEQPLLGVGTGGFPAAFAKQIQGTDALLTVNPHNEFLLITMQAGLAGLVLLLYLFYTHWRCAAQLGSALEQDAARGLLLMYVINCAFNSALYDHVDGLLFAYMTATFFAGYKSGQHG
jgi:O-antigen ligase